METNPRSKKKQKKFTSECGNFTYLNSFYMSPICSFHVLAFSKQFISEAFLCKLSLSMAVLCPRVGKELVKMKA